MSKKSIIIMLTIILLLFSILMIIVFINHKQNNIVESTEENHYAVNETSEKTTELNEVENQPVIPEETDNETMIINNAQINHLERLTTEQHVVKSDMVNLLNDRVNSDTQIHGNIVEENISEMSNDNTVYIEVKFSDESNKTYVIGYDSVNMHRFLRCVSLEEWESILNGDNAG